MFRQATKFNSAKKSQYAGHSSIFDWMRAGRSVSYKHRSDAETNKLIREIGVYEAYSTILYTR